MDSNVAELVDANMRNKVRYRISTNGNTIDNPNHPGSSPGIATIKSKTLKIYNIMKQPQLDVSSAVGKELGKVPVVQCNWNKHGELWRVLVDLVGDGVELTAFYPLQDKSGKFVNIYKNLFAELMIDLELKNN